MRFELATDLCDPVPIDEVEPASEILKRFATGAMSLGCAGGAAEELGLGLEARNVPARGRAKLASEPAL